MGPVQGIVGGKQGVKISKCMEKINLGYIWKITLAAAIGGFLFGYDFVVIGGAKPFYEPYFNLVSLTQKGWGPAPPL